MSVSGSCACGSVKFEAHADPKEGTYRCNCTHCTKRGWWPMSVPAEGLAFTEGEEHLVIEQPYPELDLHRRRCGRCGVHLVDWVGEAEYGGPRFSVSVRALDLANWEDLPIQWVDGLHDTWAPLGTVEHHEPDFVAASRKR